MALSKKIFFSECVMASLISLIMYNYTKINVPHYSNSAWVNAKGKCNIVDEPSNAKKLIQSNRYGHGDLHHWRGPNFYRVAPLDDL